MKRPPVILRKFQESDLDDFMEWATDEEVYRFSMRETFKSREEAEIYIKKKSVERPWWKAICLEGRVVGAINLKRVIGDSSCRAEIGYCLARRWWGKGVAAEAVKLCVSRAFTDIPGLERIEGLVESENVASQSVLEKAGFVKEGLLCKYFTFKGKTRDFYSYCFLSQDLPQCV
ncbi:hypothetical protein SUGI_0631270 [Cryptomeria japonica]|uniref:uncharacterized protein LOC131037464 n=1 Tax=Cryptomeria japonica TaxID=3369 RepID=UPI002414C088|nr:uncharacterized protein LOC131037464 [Cryptomeria japonica]GLJ31453.1 hypothetical protein SUGI_0631270 [Cryptomeria japonica]